MRSLVYEKSVAESSKLLLVASWKSYVPPVRGWGFHANDGVRG